MDIEDDLKCDWNDSENMTVWYVAGKVAEYLTDIVMDAASSTECVLATLPDVWDRRGNGKPSIGIVSIKEVLEEANRRGITIPEEFGLFCPYNQVWTVMVSKEGWVFNLVGEQRSMGDA